MDTIVYKFRCRIIPIFHKRNIALLEMEVKMQLKGHNPMEGSLENKNLCATLSKAIDMSKVTEKD